MLRDRIPPISFAYGSSLRFCLSGDKSALAYFSYLFSTYALIVGVRGFVQLLNWLGKRIRNSRLSRRLHQNPLVAQYLDDPIYRTQFTLFGNVIINAAYMVSMLSLEAAMIARFGDPSEPLFRAKMIGITGFVICLLVVLLSMLMIIHAAKE